MSKKEYKYNNSAFFFRYEEAVSFQLLLKLHKIESENKKVTIDNRVYYVVEYNYKKEND